MLADLARQVRIEAIVRDRLDAAGAPGAAIALSLDGARWSAGIGHADLAGATPLAADAVFCAYSITKTIIATIVMRFVEEKALDLDMPVQEYVPEIPVTTPILLRQVLNHTGGLPDYGGMAEYYDAVREHPGQPWSAGEFLVRTLANGLLYMPGHGWRYSNIGYLLLRRILEQETGLTFPQVVRACLAEPFGLEGIAGLATVADVAALTPGYTLEDRAEPVRISDRYHPGWVSHGVVAASALELVRFFDMLMDAACFDDRQPLEEMLVGAPVAEHHPWMEKPSYGLGLMIDPGNRHGVVAGHSGGGPGYATAAWHFPNVAGHRLTAVALVNRNGGDPATDIVFTVANRLADILGAP